MDLVAALSDEDSVAWYMNSSPDPLTRMPGDANDDGRFDQQDIVAVLRAGRYLKGQPAGWREGDWNLDGVFDQLDLVFALQSGSFR